MPKFTDLTGHRFGKLIVISREPNKGNFTMWLCHCDCGNETVVYRNGLTQGRTKSCGCLKSDSSRNNINKNRRKPLDTKIAFTNNIYSIYKANAKRKNRSFELTRYEFENLIFSNCHYCEIFPNTKRFYNKKIFFYNGIDRKDNYRDYTLDNCKPCCKQCNFAKFKFTYNEFQNYLNRIRNGNKS